LNLIGYQNRLSEHISACAGGAVATASSAGFPELVNAVHGDNLAEAHVLNQQLCDAFATADADCFFRVKVNQIDLHLPAIPRIDGAGSVNDRQPLLYRQSTTRVHQTDLANGHRHGDSRAHQTALPRRQGDVLSGVEIDARVFGVRPVRERERWVNLKNFQRTAHEAPLYKVVAAPFWAQCMNTSASLGAAAASKKPLVCG